MKSYTFRPYFAYDCDSTMGFNNGHYLNEVTVIAADEDSARRAVLEILADDFNFGSIDEDEADALQVDVAWTFDRVWRAENGTEYQTEDDIPRDPDTGEQIETECGYLYQYLDLGEPEVSASEEQA